MNNNLNRSDSTFLFLLKRNIIFQTGQVRSVKRNNFMLLKKIIIFIYCT